MSKTRTKKKHKPTNSEEFIRFLQSIIANGKAENEMQCKELHRLRTEKAELETTISLSAGEAAKLQAKLEEEVKSFCRFRDEKEATLAEREEKLFANAHRIVELESQLAEREEEIKRLGEQLDAAKRVSMPVEDSRQRGDDGPSRPVRVEVHVTV